MEFGGLMAISPALGAIFGATFYGDDGSLAYVYTKIPGRCHPKNYTVLIDKKKIRIPILDPSSLFGWPVVGWNQLRHPAKWPGTPQSLYHHLENRKKALLSTTSCCSGGSPSKQLIPCHWRLMKGFLWGVGGTWGAKGVFKLSWKQCFDHPFGFENMVPPNWIVNQC